jgi:hypothetical protein
MNYTEQERINRLEHLLKEQDNKSEKLKEAMCILTASLQMELGSGTCNAILGRIDKI